MRNEERGTRNEEQGIVVSLTLDTMKLTTL